VSLVAMPNSFDTGDGVWAGLVRAHWAQRQAGVGCVRDGDGSIEEPLIPQRARADCRRLERDIRPGRPLGWPVGN